MLPSLTIKNKKITIPIFQGGMGIGVSMANLAGAVSKEGGFGIISSAAIDRLVSNRLKRKVDNYEATFEEVSYAKSIGKMVGINIMVALTRFYKDTVKAAIEAGVDAIVSGAGLPLDLPTICPIKDTALIPIVSSARSLELICKKWERHGYRPDAAVLEGPLAGGHLGFKLLDINSEEHSLEKLLPQLLDVAKKYGDFPVIAAGGIFTHEDIVKFLKMGASGVQLGTRFVVTHESGATAEYKEAIVKATKEDIVVATNPGSPCGLPFRVIKSSPMYMAALNRLRKPLCNLGYLLGKDSEGKFSKCLAKEDNDKYFCICNGLLSSAGVNPFNDAMLFTVGAKAYLVDKITSVKELMDELSGKIKLPQTPVLQGV